MCVVVVVVVVVVWVGGCGWGVFGCVGVFVFGCTKHSQTLKTSSVSFSVLYLFNSKCSHLHTNVPLKPIAFVVIDSTGAYLIANVSSVINVLIYEGSQRGAIGHHRTCSAIRVAWRSAMGRRVDPSWWTH